jgi:hypothetical protein
MPYALRSSVNTNDLEIAEILMDLKKTMVVPVENNNYDSTYKPNDVSYDDSDDEDYVDEEEKLNDVSHDDSDDDEEYVPEEDAVDDEEYVPEEDAVDDEEYVPEEVAVDDEEYVPEEVAVDDEEYVPEEVAVDDEEYVPEEDAGYVTEDDEEYVPHTEESFDSVIREACSSLSKGEELPRAFWRVMGLARKNRVSSHFKRWMLSIPPVKSIYTSFSKRR